MTSTSLISTSNRFSRTVICIATALYVVFVCRISHVEDLTYISLAVVNAIICSWHMFSTRVGEYTLSKFINLFILVFSWWPTPYNMEKTRWHLRLYWHSPKRITSHSNSQHSSYWLYTTHYIIIGHLQEAGVNFSSIIPHNQTFHQAGLYWFHS